MTRQIFSGAGKLGVEALGVTRAEVPYQLTQRADFFEEEIGLETTLKRPIVNARDEPHADAQKYRRLHVIIGDANLSEVATYLKVGTTSIVLAMIEDDELGSDLALVDPVTTLRAVSYDLSLRRPLNRVEGGTMTALDLQWEYLDARTQVRRGPRPRVRRRRRRGRRPGPLGAGARRARNRPDDLGRPARLGRQAAPDPGLPRPPRPPVGRRPAGRRRLAIPRPAPGTPA